MPVSDMYNSNACSIFGRWNGLESWTWEEYEIKKTNLWDKLVLVDMIGHPIKDSVQISDELFNWNYPKWTIFALYCHSWGSSWYLQSQIAPQMSEYTFVNMSWWIMSL